MGVKWTPNIPNIPVSHDAKTYMDYLPLHKKNQQNKIAQCLCTSSDE